MHTHISIQIYAYICKHKYIYNMYVHIYLPKYTYIYILIFYMTETSRNLNKRIYEQKTLLKPQPNKFLYHHDHITLPVRISFLTL